MSELKNNLALAEKIEAKIEEKKCEKRKNHRTLKFEIRVKKQRVYEYSRGVIFLAFNNFTQFIY